MLNYLREFVNFILSGTTKNSGPLREQVRQVCQEVNRLDILDFEPSAQFPLLKVRAQLAHFAETTGWSAGPMYDVMRELVPLLELYAGQGAGKTVRSFAYLTDPNLRPIIERDYTELSSKLFPSEAWKSTVILAGSILEAILFDVLSDARRVALANASAKAPKGKGGVPTDVRSGDWTLATLIAVTVDIGVLPGARADTIDQVLRDYRNFVYPKKEVRAKHQCTEAEAGLAKFGLDGVCNHLEATL
ncbi:MAG: hypothetical protein J0I06_16950 [Planctomycetes bacterium]|nr:hypothetical protein [Planctomycetota bacterium]